MAKSKQKYILPIIALVAAYSLWGINTSFIKLGLETIPVPIFMGIRFLAASLIVLPFALKTWKKLKFRDLSRFILASVMYISLSAVALNVALTKTTALNAAVIWLLGPIILFLLSASFLKEKLSLRTFIGILVALVGSVIIIGRPWDGAVGDATSVTGNLLLLVSVFCDVLAVIIAKPLMKKVSSYQATFLNIFPGIVPVAVYGLTQLPNWDVAATSRASVTALVLSIFTVTIANFLFFYALRYKKAQSTGVYHYLDPLVTVIGAWFILSERPTPKFIVGAALVVLGIYLAEIYKAHVPAKVNWRLRQQGRRI